MIRRGKFGSGLIIAFLLLSTLSAAQEKPVEIKLTIKYNDRTVAAPDHITLSSPGRVATVTVNFTREHLVLGRHYRRKSDTNVQPLLGRICLRELDLVPGRPALQGLRVRRSQGC
jgi:hypothetical protein